MTPGPTIAVLAGEASGDQHAAAVVEVLRDRHPSARFVGMGGPRMKELGVELLAELDDLAVMGFAEVLPRVPYFLGLEKRVLEMLSARGVALLVLVDYPGFNMRIAEKARRLGIKVVYYVAPQVWAWKKKRAARLARDTDRVAVILPFEKAFLARQGVSATYVGHPLLDRPDDVVDEVRFRERWGLEPDRPLLAVLPGSRGQELHRHLDPFRRIAERVASERPDVVPVFSRAPTMSRTALGELPFPVVDDTRALLRHAAAALVKSGTSTLEAALEDTPHVIAYRVSPFSKLVADVLVDIEHIGLPNLVAGRRVVPEYLQDDVEPREIAAVLIDLLAPDSRRRAEQLEGLAQVRERLGEPGAAARVADLCDELLGAAAP